MPALNTRTAGVVDAILSTHARGYRNLEFVSQALFPRVPVPSRNMRVIRFGKEGFRMISTRRAPGANVKRVQYGYASDPISLVQDALEGVVPVEHQQEAEGAPGVDLGAGAIDMVMGVVDLGLEYEAARIARDVNTYAASNRAALAGTSRWTSATSKPLSDVRAAREVIRRNIGRYPNVLQLGPTAANALVDHPSVREQFKYTTKESITVDMLAAYFDVEKVVVGKGVYLPETALDTDAATDIWGDDAILAYVPQQGQAYGAPSYGYTYELEGYPQVEEPYYDRPTKSWIYPTTVERRPYVVGADAGFLFQSAGAPAA
ncbi:major capsid protein [Paracoccus contaminans]|nr:major capsid protein [Paracoccus contaminans]